MPVRQHPLMWHVVGKYLLARWLFCFWIFALSPPLLLLLWVRGNHEEWATPLSWVALPLFVGWVVSSWFLGKSMAHHIVDENRTFLPAARYSLWDLRLHLAFFPIVGRWFQPRGSERADDEEVD